MFGDVGGIDHVDGVPRAPAFAQGAADAAFQVDVHERLDGRLVLARHLVDAIDRTDFDAGFAAGAVVGPDDGQFLRELFASLARAFGHEWTSSPGIAWTVRATGAVQRLGDKRRAPPRVRG